MPLNYQDVTEPRVEGCCFYKDWGQHTQELLVDDSTFFLCGICSGSRNAVHFFGGVYLSSVMLNFG